MSTSTKAITRDSVFDQIKDRYITTDLASEQHPSLQALADEFGVDYAMVKAAWSNQNWTALRNRKHEIFLRKVEAAENKLLEQEAIDLAKERHKIIQSRINLSELLDEMAAQLKEAVLNGDLAPKDLIKAMALVLGSQESLWKIFQQLEGQLNPDADQTAASKFLDDIIVKVKIAEAAKNPGIKTDMSSEILDLEEQKREMENYGK